MPILLRILIYLEYKTNLLVHAFSSAVDITFKYALWCILRVWITQLFSCIAHLWKNHAKLFWLIGFVRKASICRLQFYALNISFYTCSMINDTRLFHQFISTKIRIFYSNHLKLNWQNDFSKLLLRLLSGR